MAQPSLKQDKDVAQPRSKPGRGRPSKASKSDPLQSAKDELYRQHILVNAEVVFADQGYAGAKMQEIAKAASVSLTTLYQSFPGKSELYRAVLISRDEEMLAAVMAEATELLKPPGSVEQVLSLMRVHLQYLLDHPDYLRMQLQEGVAWYHSASRPSDDEERLWNQGLGLMAQVFAWGSEAGLFIPGEAEEQARLLLALQQVRLANWVAGDMQQPHDEVIGHVQADFVRNFCRPQVAATLLSEDGSKIS